MLTLASIAVVDADTFLRVIYAILCLGGTFVMVGEYRKESGLADAHLVFCGTVTSVKTAARGRRQIHYVFTAADGKPYQGESDWGRPSLMTGHQLLVLCRPDDPAVNKPAARFLFYTFQSYGQE